MLRNAAERRCSRTTGSKSDGAWITARGPGSLRLQRASFLEQSGRMSGKRSRMSLEGLKKRGEPWYVQGMSAPGVSIEATLPDVERLLVDFARLVAHGNPQEAMERLQRVIATKRGRRALALTEPGRAALSLVLSERRVAERSEQRGPTTSLRANARRTEHVEMAAIAAIPPALAPEVAERVAEILREYERVDELATVGLRPTRTVLIFGPPGVGKTRTMQYIASAMGRPLMHIEPSDVIGSYLGESARSLVDAFEAARTAGAVLGLDEVDALAKRR